jgi:hypothetical protein
MQATSISSYLATPLGFIVFFLALWSGVCFLASSVSGWHALSRRFTKRSEPYGETKTAGPFFYTVHTRFWSHYGGVIRVTAAQDALYLSVLFLFRIAHPPLRIPWDEIQITRTKFLWRRLIQLTLGSQEKISMRISERMARNLGILDRVPK